MSKSSRAVGGPLEPSVKRQAMPTPGPWLVDEDQRPGMQWNRHILSADSAAICFMAHGRSAAADAANARLIAAAPDLFDVVQALVLAQQQGSDPALMVAEDSPLMDAARDALLKVCGVPAA